MVPIRVQGCNVDLDKIALDAANNDKDVDDRMNTQ
jgi:hypothetical protein